MRKTLYCRYFGHFFPKYGQDYVFFLKELCSISFQILQLPTIQKLKTEFWRYLCGLSAPVMKEIFTKRVLKYNFQTFRVTLLSNPKTKKYGTDMVAYKATQSWSMQLARYGNL